MPDRTDLFDPDGNAAFRERIDALSVASAPGWGKLDVAGMCNHCARPMEVAL